MLYEFANIRQPWGTVGLALLLVYIVWGTTHFAIGIALQNAASVDERASAYAGGCGHAGLGLGARREVAHGGAVAQRCAGGD